MRARGTVRLRAIPLMALMVWGGMLFASIPETLATPDLAARERRRGVVERSQARKHLFWRMTGYPKGRPGYAVDHLVPLACGGSDLPGNMQWLTEAEWSRKTPWERKPCSAWFDGTNARLLQHAIDGCATGRTPKELCK